MAVGCGESSPASFAARASDGELGVLGVALGDPVVADLPGRARLHEPEPPVIPDGATADRGSAEHPRHRADAREHLPARGPGDVGRGGRQGRVLSELHPGFHTPRPEGSATMGAERRVSRLAPRAPAAYIILPAPASEVVMPPPSRRSGPPGPSPRLTRAPRGGAASLFRPVALPPGARVFVLTGAGISAESGIQTFRDANGLWEQYRFEEVASPEGWARDPELVWRFYSERRAQAATCRPNAAHRALADLERRLGDRLLLCTQNVDDLHEKAGHERLVHMHGELMKSRCEACSRAAFADAIAHRSIPRCECGARIRPHIVWFGEVPFELDRIASELAACDVFVTIGSSGAVYPAAGFVNAIRARAQHREPGPLSVYVGPDEPDNASMFDECRLGRAGDVVPGLFSIES